MDADRRLPRLGMKTKIELRWESWYQTKIDFWGDARANLILQVSQLLSIISVKNEFEFITYRNATNLALVVEEVSRSGKYCGTLREHGNLSRYHDARI